ncbi:DUF262 domain-containing protein [Phycicoccus flavus]|uniref:DUF262 domain-containing protein n=1 Tax=Phycicoccus flavus TaxID=2502783 RepID=A0A8T6QY21_9MICO|nr:DUF262 domain-containing protein [Phycicoccus flavus]NHA66849.1 DUF262 domain-containing protein [Phycicoccus flavus]
MQRTLFTPEKRHMAAKDAVTLASVLGERLLLVPDYQRPYAWQQRQLEELWQDLDLMGDQTRHYAGTLVLRDRDRQHMTTSGATLLESEVVDGQQRLTTCLLLLDRIRRAFAELESDKNPAARETVAHITSTYGMVTIGGVRQPRLHLGDMLHDFWTQTVLGDQPHHQGRLTDTQQRLQDAARYFDAQIQQLVSGLNSDESLVQLRRLLSRVTNGLRFLVYDVDSSSDAGVIFETLNGRGRDLTELDKIKNYLLFLANTLPSAMAEHLSQRVNVAWSDIYGHLAGTPANEDLLLRAHWLTTVSPDVRTWKGATSLKQHFAREKYVPDASRLVTVSTAPSDADDRHQTLMECVESYVDTLRLCAMFTREMAEPSTAFKSFGSYAPRVQSRTAALLRSGVVANFRPLLFAARLSHPDDGDLYLRLTDMCERYSARVFTISRYRTNAGQARLFRRAHDLIAGVPGDDVLARLEAMIWEYADDDRVRRNLDASENWYGRDGHKYFLYEYELSKARREDDVAAFEKFTGSNTGRTTEHIAPQNPDWESDDWSVLSKEDHAKLKHSIGNLVLTYDNSSYSNKSFAAKKGTRGQGAPPCYADSTLAQESELVKYDNWTAESILDRGQHLTEWALTRWAITPPSSPTDVDDDDLVLDDGRAEPTEDLALVPDDAEQPTAATAQES